MDLTDLHLIDTLHLTDDDSGLSCKNVARGERRCIQSSSGGYVLLDFSFQTLPPITEHIP